jgi:YggT family protein
MDVILGPLLRLIVTVIDIYMWVVIVGVVLSWLVHFRVVNTANRFVFMVGDFIYRITEPVLRPIRNILPNLGGIDLSPVVLILALFFVKDMLIRLFMKLG